MKKIVKNNSGISNIISGGSSSASIVSNFAANEKGSVIDSPLNRVE